MQKRHNSNGFMTLLHYAIDLLLMPSSATKDCNWLYLVFSDTRAMSIHMPSNQYRQSVKMVIISSCLNTLRPRQNGRHFADGIFKCIFLNENVWIPLKISLTFVPKGPINNIPTLVQVMAWRRPGDKPLSEPMMVSLWTHICVTRPQWVNNGIYIVESQHLHIGSLGIMSLMYTRWQYKEICVTQNSSTHIMNFSMFWLWIFVIEELTCWSLFTVTGLWVDFFLNF